MWAGYLSRYNDWLRAGRSGDRIPLGARFYAPVQTGPGAHPVSCTMDTGSFPGIKRGRGVTLTPHPLLVPWSWKGRAIPLLPLRAVRPVQNLSACTRVHFTLFYAFKWPIPFVARFLVMRFRIPPGAWKSVCCVLSGRGLCAGLITRPEESFRVWCVWVWSWSFDNEEVLAQ